MITLEEFKNMMKSGSVAMDSKCALRNESIQDKRRNVRLPKLKREIGKQSRILFPKELAFPFDPSTGSTEVYNNDHKFRPMMSASSLGLIVKGFANEVPETKEKIMAIAGVSEWDTSNTKELNEEDRIILNHFAYPQIFTIPVINTTLKALSNVAWGRNYIVNIQRDEETGQVLGDEYPLPLAANRFYNSIANEKIKAYEQANKNAEKKDDEKTQDEVKRDIRQKCNKVSSDFPSNYAVVYELPLTDSGVLDSKVIKTVTVEKLNEMRVLTRYSAELKGVIGLFRTGNYKKNDTNLDFYEFDMLCPTEGNKEDMSKIAKDTRYVKMDSEYALKKEESYDNFYDTYNQQVDNNGDIEQLVLASTGLTAFNEDVEAKMLEALEADIDIHDSAITKKVIESNKDFISRVFGESGDELIMEVEADVSDRAEGQLDVEQAMKEGKEFDISKILDEPDDDDVSEAVAFK